MSRYIDLSRYSNNRQALLMLMMFIGVMLVTAYQHGFLFAGPEPVAEAPAQSPAIYGVSPGMTEGEAIALIEAAGFTFGPCVANCSEGSKAAVTDVADRLPGAPAYQRHYVADLDPNITVAFAAMRLPGAEDGAWRISHVSRKIDFRSFDRTPLEDDILAEARARFGLDKASCLHHSLAEAAEAFIFDAQGAAIPMHGAFNQSFRSNCLEHVYAHPGAYPGAATMIELHSLPTDTARRDVALFRAGLSDIGMTRSLRAFERELASLDRPTLGDF